MTVSQFDDARTLAETLASRVIRRIRLTPDLVLGLPTGRTPKLLYAALRAQSVAGAIDWSRVRTFNLDEFTGIDPSLPGSFRAYMDRELFTAVGATPANIGFLNGAAADLEAECDRFERAVAAAGGIDVMLLGIGVNGHVGFNEPGEGLHARTHRARLADVTRQANAYLFDGDVSRVPPEAMSMGMATILAAREIVLIATGPEKAAAVAGMLDGPVTTRLPASFLQLHPNVTVMLDRGASAR